MGSPYLSSDEAILLSTHNIVINTIPAEAILTSRRLVLVDSSHPQFRPQDIPFTAIETVTIGENSGNDPVLSLTVVTKGDVRQTLGIIFSQPAKTKRTGERDSWAVKLKELIATSQEGHGAQPMDLAPPWLPGSLFAEESGEKGSGQDLSDKYRNPPLVPKRPRSVRFLQEPGDHCDKCDRYRCHRDCLRDVFFCPGTHCTDCGTRSAGDNSGRCFSTGPGSHGTPHSGTDPAAGTHHRNNNGPNHGTKGHSKDGCLGSDQLQR